MPALGKTINLYLMDGAASGRWQAYLSNWNGRAYKIPRQDLKDSNELTELNSPGVYFLFGKDDESGKQFIYVGEADDILKRLAQPHTFEKDGSYWTEAVAFVTPDGTLEKGRIKYLENRFYTIATVAGRFIIKNGNTPKQSPMPKQIRDLLEEFILNVRLILPALGYLAFEPKPSSDTNDQEEDSLLYFSRKHGKGGQATGKITSDGFWLLKGSYIYPQVAEYTASGIKKARAEYVDKIDEHGILQEDICFGSPSYAATFVCGKNSNGLVEWKNKNNVSLKNIDSAGDTDGTSKKELASAQPAVAKSQGKELLHLAGRKVHATGYINANGFVVCKGSDFYFAETKSCQQWIKDLRKRLLHYKKVVDGKFIEDVQFYSPSAAAACVTGGSVNGNKMWLYPDGKSINDKTGK